MKNLISKKWFIILLFCATFLTGAASGVLVESLFILNRVEAFIGNGPEFITNILQTRLTSKLSLTDEQQKQLAAILDESQTKVRGVRDQAAPQIWQIIQDARGKITKILTPDQLIKFNHQMALAREHLSKSPFFPSDEEPQNSSSAPANSTITSSINPKK